MKPILIVVWMKSYPKGAYRCLVLDSDFETARFQEALNKRFDKRFIICLLPSRRQSEAPEVMRGKVNELITISQ